MQVYRPMTTTAAPGLAAQGSLTLKVVALDLTTILRADSAVGIVEVGGAGTGCYALQYGFLVDPGQSYIAIWTDHVTDGALPTIQDYTALHPEQDASAYYSFTPTVRDTGGHPIRGVTVLIQNQAGTLANPPWGISNVNGQVTGLYLQAGAYQVLVSAGPDYTPLAPQALTILGTGPQTATYALTSRAPAPPPPTGLCAVEFFLTLNGTPKGGYRCEASLVGKNQAADDEVFSNVVDRAITAGDGTATLYLVRQDQFVNGTGRYQFRVFPPGSSTPTHEFQALIPNQNTVNFQDLIPT